MEVALPSEPMTIGARLTFGTVSVIVMGRIIERWLVMKSQQQMLDSLGQINLTLETESKDAVKTFQELFKTFGKASVALGPLAKAATEKKPPR